MVTFSDRVVVPTHVLVRHFDGESVLLNLESEIYFGLDSMGTRMWEVATRAASIEAAYAALLQEFEVEPEVLRANLVELISRLVENGLLKLASTDIRSLPTV